MKRIKIIIRSPSYTILCYVKILLESYKKRKKTITETEEEEEEK